MLWHLTCWEACFFWVNQLFVVVRNLALTRKKSLSFHQKLTEYCSPSVEQIPILDFYTEMHTAFFLQLFLGGGGAGGYNQYVQLRHMHTSRCWLLCKNKLGETNGCSTSKCPVMFCWMWRRWGPCTGLMTVMCWSYGPSHVGVLWRGVYRFLCSLFDGGSQSHPFFSSRSAPNS